VRMIQRLVKLFVSVLITSLVCIVCTFAVMNTYIDMILDQYQLKSSAFTAPSWSQFVAHIEKQAAGFNLFGSAARTAADRPVSTKPIADNNELQSGSDGSKVDPQQPQPKSTIRETPPDDALAVFGQQAGTTQKKPAAEVNPPRSTVKGETIDSGIGAAAGSGRGIDSVSGSADKPGSINGTDTSKVVVSSEEFAKKKEQLSSDDKNKIFKLLMTRIPQAEIQKISQIMEDGITASELKDIEQLLQNYLKPEEYSQLLSMIKPE
jgi:hypothetical protein